MRVSAILPQAVPGAEGCILVERAALAKHLLLEARRLFPAIDFQFDIYIVVRICSTRHVQSADEELMLDSCWMVRLLLPVPCKVSSG